MEKINKEIILNDEDTLNMLDQILDKWNKDWWDNFYSDKDRDIPFFTDAPDENLVELVESMSSEGKQTLDIGCGNGRNCIYLAKQGYDSTGIDLSKESIDWAKGTARDKDIKVNFINGSFFNIEFSHKFNLIHDSGCLHHIKPHRRSKYLEKVSSLLEDDGVFSLTCFNLKGGANISDYEVYSGGSMQGGIGYSVEKLTMVLEPYFEILEIRDMKETTSKDIYGLDICLVARMKKK